MNNDRLANLLFILMAIFLAFGAVILPLSYHIESFRYFLVVVLVLMGAITYKLDKDDYFNDD